MWPTSLASASLHPPQWTGYRRSSRRTSSSKCSTATKDKFFRTSPQKIKNPKNPTNTNSSLKRMRTLGLGLSSKKRPTPKTRSCEIWTLKKKSGRTWVRTDSFQSRMRKQRRAGFFNLKEATGSSHPSFNVWTSQGLNEAKFKATGRKTRTFTRRPTIPERKASREKPRTSTAALTRVSAAGSPFRAGAAGSLSKEAKEAAKNGEPLT